MARQPYMGLGLLVSSRLHDHTHLRHTTLGRTTLDEWPARSRDFCLTTHNPHNRQTYMPPVGYFLPVRGFPPPPWSIFVLFKSFRPSCHFTFHATVLTTNTTQTSMPQVGFFFPVPLFPFDPFCTFKSFRPSSCHLWSILVLIQQTQHKHPCPRLDFFFLSRYFPLIHFVRLNPSVLLHVTYVPYIHLCPYTTNTTQTSMPPVGFEPTIPASERPQTHALDRTTTQITR
jgi:hypothetical protein